MGHLIPAGTGFPLHRDIKIVHLGEPTPLLTEGEEVPALA